MRRSSALRPYNAPSLPHIPTHCWPGRWLVSLTARVVTSGKLVPVWIIRPVHDKSNLQGRDGSRAERVDVQSGARVEPSRPALWARCIVCVRTGNVVWALGAGVLCIVGRSCWLGTVPPLTNRPYIYYHSYRHGAHSNLTCVFHL